MLATTASRHQAVASSAAAQARATIPRRERWMPRSVRMRASTGKAVTESDTPMNSANTRNETSLVE